MSKKRQKRAKQSRPERLDIGKTLNNGLAHQQSGRNHQAKALFKKVLAHNPHHPDALHLLGLCHVQEGRLDHAAKLLEKAAGIGNKVGVYHYNLGNVQNLRGRHEEALSALNNALHLQPGVAEIHNSLGVALCGCGKFSEAITHFTEAARIKPGYAEAFSNLGSALLEQGESDRAVAVLERAIQLAPGSEKAHNNLGNARMIQGKPALAVPEYREAHKLAPADGEVMTGLGNSLLAVGEPTEALSWFEQASRQEPERMECHLGLGAALERLGRYDEALERYNCAHKLEPNSSAPLTRLGSCCAALGRFTEAATHLNRAIDLTPSSSSGRAKLARIRGGGEGNELAEDILRLLARADLPDDERRSLSFAMGNLLDGKGNHAEAFQYFREGNRLKRASFDLESHCTGLLEMRRLFSSEFFRKRQAWGSESDRPIFIVGMPRSGTTLVEQVLASHTKVFGAGELSHFDQLSAHLRGDGDAPTLAITTQDLTQERVQELAENHLGTIGELGGEKPYVTDKMPTNFIHLGLIALLFPRAHIIHCTRDPMDSCLSNYFHDFKGNLPFAYDLTDLGGFYRAYTKLMEHWHEVLPMPILDLSYEEMVANTEEMVRRLLEFCDLEWEPACLEFHLTERAVKTASQWQVRQPIYSRSVARWRHYEPFLEPLKRALEGD